MRYDAVVVGGGAAGLFCAFTAAQRGRKVLLVEHNAQCGRKIIISGGGRCNFTNLHTSPENFISENPHFCKSALARYTPDDFLRLVRKHKIANYEKKLGQMFCTENSRQIVDMLLRECGDADVEIRVGCTIRKLWRDKFFELETSSGHLSAENVVIATGGLSYPKIGATDLGYRVAEQFGIARTKTRPSLVGLVFPEAKRNPKLAGVSVDALVSIDKASFREKVLFTHRGMSGPAILQISNYWETAEPVTIDLLPTADIRELIGISRELAMQVSTYLAKLLPARVVDSFPDRKLLAKPLRTLSDRDIDAVGKLVHRQATLFVDTEGYDRAEVTLGGVSTSELSSQTMESSRVHGLYFIGEVVDVTGWLGGYNFQWAWASGNAAGSSL